MTEIYGGGTPFNLLTVDQAGLEVWRTLDMRSLKQPYAMAAETLNTTNASWARMFMVPSEVRARIVQTDTPTRVHQIGGLVLQDIATHIVLDSDLRHGRDVQFTEIATIAGKRALEVTAFLDDRSQEALQWEQDRISRRLQDMTRSSEKLEWKAVTDRLVLAHVPKRSPDTAGVLRAAFRGVRRARLSRLQMNELT